MCEQQGEANQQHLLLFPQKCSLLLKPPGTRGATNSGTLLFLPCCQHSQEKEVSPVRQLTAEAALICTLRTGISQLTRSSWPITSTRALSKGMRRAARQPKLACSGDFFLLPPFTSYLLQRWQPTGWCSWMSVWWSPQLRTLWVACWIFSRQEFQEQNLAQKRKEKNK